MNNSDPSDDRRRDAKTPLPRGVVENKGDGPFAGVHLANLGEGRERESLARLLDCPLDENDLWSFLGTKPSLAWIAINIPENKLLTPHLCHPDPKRDIDLLIAPMLFDPPLEDASWREIILADAELLAWHKVSGTCPGGYYMQLIARGHLAWPPAIRPTGAAEVKAACWTVEGRPRGTKQGRADRFRGQSMRLVELGFPDSAFIRIMAAEPDSDPPGNSFMAALSRAADALDFAADNLVGRPSDPFAEFVWSVGAVAHKTEDEAGAGRPHCVREAGMGLGPTIRVRHEAYEAICTSLQAAVARLPRPITAPTFILCCEEPTCRELFLDHRPGARHCADCWHSTS